MGCGNGLCELLPGKRVVHGRLVRASWASSEKYHGHNWRKCRRKPRGPHVRGVDGRKFRMGPPRDLRSFEIAA